MERSDKNDKQLAIVTSYFNPAGFKNKPILHAECKQRIPELFTVECLFNDINGILRDSEINSDIKVTGDVMWQKERLLNIAISDRLAAGYKNICWIDFDIEFINSDWRENILESLEKYNVVQCFNKFTSEYPDKQLNGESIVSLYSNRQPYHGSQMTKGGAWAAPKRLLDDGFLLYDRHVSGAGDSIFVFLIMFSMNGRFPNSDFVYKGNKILQNSVNKWLLKNSVGIKNSFGSVNNSVVFRSHGKYSDRKYTDINVMLAENNFDPEIDIVISDSGGFVWNSDKEKLHSIMNEYFIGRREDT